MKKLPCLMALLMLITGCARTDITTRTAFMLDTFVTITLYGSSDPAAMDTAFEVIRRFDESLNRRNPESEVARLSGRQQWPVEISAELAALLEISVRHASRSAGAFDITIAPVVDLWFADAQTPPSPEKIAAALERVDYSNILLDGRLLTLQNGAELELGGIAKGFIADEVGRALEGFELYGALINLGGDILAIGEREFNIGINSPMEGRIIGSVKINNSAVATAGVYERYFIYGGRRYHHIIDARTGVPVDTGIVSVTVTSPSAADADALSTIALILGVEQGSALIENTPGARAVFLLEDGSILSTDPDMLAENLR